MVTLFYLLSLTTYTECIQMTLGERHVKLLRYLRNPVAIKELFVFVREIVKSRIVMC